MTSPVLYQSKSWLAKFTIEVGTAATEITLPYVPFPVNEIRIKRIRGEFSAAPAAAVDETELGFGFQELENGQALGCFSLGVGSRAFCVTNPVNFEEVRIVYPLGSEKDVPQKLTFFVTHNVDGFVVPAAAALWMMVTFEFVQWRPVPFYQKQDAAPKNHDVPEVPLEDYPLKAAGLMPKYGDLNLQPSVPMPSQDPSTTGTTLNVFKTKPVKRVKK